MLHHWFSLDPYGVAPVGRVLCVHSDVCRLEENQRKKERQGNAGLPSEEDRNLAKNLKKEMDIFSATVEPMQVGARCCMLCVCQADALRTSRSRHG